MTDAARLRDRLLKIRSLAERGVGGERLNAQRVLEALLRQHGLTDADLDAMTGEELVLAWFPWRDLDERGLLVQTVAMVTDVVRPNSYRRSQGKQRLLAFRLTRAQQLQVEYAYRLFRRAWRLAREEFFLAFIWRSEVFAPRTLADEARAAAVPLAPDERQRARRIRGFMDSIEPVVVRAGLSSGDRHA